MGPSDQPSTIDATTVDARGFSLVYLLLLPKNTIYAAYICHGHGDRNPKRLPPTNLTTLGYDQILSAGNYYHSRYVDSKSPNHIVGTVLQNSEQAFLQRLYPSVGALTETFAKGTTLGAPCNGYQLITVSLVDARTSTEGNGWLQNASGCYNAKISSNNYFSSNEYKDLLSSTKDFYTSLAPVVNQTFGGDYMTFKNAYTIFDIINVAVIPSRTIPSSSLLDSTIVHTLQLLANQPEYGLAFYATDNAYATPGMQLAGEIVSFLSKSISSKGQQTRRPVRCLRVVPLFIRPRWPPTASPVFTNIPDYASSMVLELLATNASANSFPETEDLSVRFFFSNGSTGVLGALTPYALFGGNALIMPWSELLPETSGFGVKSTQKWSQVCGNSTGVCTAYSGAGGKNATTETSDGHGMSNAVAGVIGAMVTLAVVLGLEALIALISGLRIVKKTAGVSGVEKDGVEA